MANSVDSDQTAPIGAVCSGSTLFDSILKLSVMLGNYLQQTTSAEAIFRCIFSWRFKGKFSFQNGYFLKVFEGHNSLVQAVAFSPNGQYLVSFLILCMLGNFPCFFCCLQIFFQN